MLARPDCCACVRACVCVRVRVGVCNSHHCHLVQTTSHPWALITAARSEERLLPLHCLLFKAPLWKDRLFTVFSSPIPRGGGGTLSDRLPVQLHSVPGKKNASVATGDGRLQQVESDMYIFAVHSGKSSILNTAESMCVSAHTSHTHPCGCHTEAVAILTSD